MITHTHTYATLEVSRATFEDVEARLLAADVLDEYQRDGLLVLGAVALKPVGVEVGSVVQKWLSTISMMQQTVLLTVIRGPDGITKYGPAKMLLRWYRRCILLSAMDGAVLPDPVLDGGGSFTGPSAPGYLGVNWEEGMNKHADAYLRDLDGIPRHFQAHLMHGTEILGYKHPDERTRAWWHKLYLRLVNDLHLHPETEAELDSRLGDSRSGWLARADPATVE
jgi:hypothetical protein